MTQPFSVSAESVAKDIVASLQAGNFAQAEEICRRAIAAGAVVPRLYFYLGAALEGQGKLESALESFDNALKHDAGDIHGWAAKLSVLVQQQRFSEAIEVASLACSIHPGSAFLKGNLGNVLTQTNKLPQALEAYRQALLLNPKEPTALIHMSSVLVKMGQHELAVSQAQIALRILPCNIEIMNNLAEAHIQRHEFETALEVCDEALRLEFDDATIHFKRGLVLSYLQRYAGARQEFAMAANLDSQVASKYYPHLANDPFGREITIIPELIFLDVSYHQQTQCNWTYREEYIRTLHEMLLNHTGEIRLGMMSALGFQMISLPIDGKDRLKLITQLARRFSDAVAQDRSQPFEHQRRAGNKIRLGYVSPDFRIHPVGLLSRLIYGLHDRDRFEVYAYSLHQSEKTDDAVHAHITQTCDVFHDVSCSSFADIAEQIHADSIDILVDLAGYTTHACPEIFALRPAPIQIAYLGYPGTTGADFMDYAIVDHTIVSEEGRAHWSEQLIRLPNVHCPYDFQLDNSPTHRNRSDFGLAEGAVVLCCFNNSYKIEPGIFAAWMHIVKAVPGSLLWILGLQADTKANLQKSAEEAGISADRLVFAGVLPHAEHIKRYQLANLFLDTYWHNAHTTAADALWQGLPVLTCQGAVASSRLASSLLHALDLQDELVVETLDQYQEKAIFYARNREALAAVRHKLAANRHTQPLFDTALTVNHLEQGYIAAWERYQAGQPPAAIDIADSRKNLIERSV
ncbi:MAG TPA: tetratricopeptide repeat protein [Methylophilaceae bacterium]|nr:tetratricopeptide repeat protein [Methylophilaceae bacterium]